MGQLTVDGEKTMEKHGKPHGFSLGKGSDLHVGFSTSYLIYNGVNQDGKPMVSLQEYDVITSGGSPHVRQDGNLRRPSAY